MTVASTAVVTEAVKSPHLAALVWITVCSAAIVFILNFVGLNVITISGAGVDENAVEWKAELAILTDKLVTTAIMSALLAIALSGVRHLLSQSSGSTRRALPSDMPDGGFVRGAGGETDQSGDGGRGGPPTLRQP